MLEKFKSRLRLNKSLNKASKDNKDNENFKSFRNFLTSLLLILVLNLLILISFNSSLNVSAQITGQTNQEEQPALEIDQQAEELQIKQLSETELRERKIELEKELSDLKKEIDDLIIQRETLKKTISNLREEVKTLAEKKDEAKNNTAEALESITEPETGRETTLTKDEIQDEIDKLNEALKESQKEDTDLALALSEKVAKRETLEEKIANIELELEQKSVEVNDQLGQFREEIFKEVVKYSSYFFLIIAYWLIFKFLSNFVEHNREIPESIKSFLNLALMALTLFATIITLFFAFLGNLSFILTSVGVLSAALVVALQDFVSSFFAWITVKSRNQIKDGDIVNISTSRGVITGKVREIGLFWTTLEEKIGGDGPDSERYTGSLTYIPNNLLLREPVSNFVQEDRIVWYQTDINISFEEDYELAEKSLKKAIKEHYEYVIENSNRLLETNKTKRKKFEPKMYFSITNTGPKFTIWFASKVDNSRVVIEDLSKRILRAFRKSKVNFSYPTKRVISMKEDELPEPKISLEKP